MAPRTDSNNSNTSGESAVSQTELAYTTQVDGWRKSFGSRPPPQQARPSQLETVPESGEASPDRDVTMSEAPAPPPREPKSLRQQQMKAKKEAEKRKSPEKQQQPATPAPAERSAPSQQLASIDDIKALRVNAAVVVKSSSPIEVKQESVIDVDDLLLGGDGRLEMLKEWLGHWTKDASRMRAFLGGKIPHMCMKDKAAKKGETTWQPDKDDVFGNLRDSSTKVKRNVACKNCSAPRNKSVAKTPCVVFAWVDDEPTLLLLPADGGHDYWDEKKKETS